MTGRGAGYCGGFGVPGFMNPMPGLARGMGFGRGRGGRGWRHWFYATGLPFWARTPAQGVVPPMAAEPTVEHQTQALKAQAALMEKSLEQLRNRIAELEAAQSNAQ